MAERFALSINQIVNDKTLELSMPARFFVHILRGMKLQTILKWLDFKPEKRSKQGSFYSCLAANIIYNIRPFFQTAMPFFVGNRVTCNAAGV